MRKFNRFLTAPGLRKTHEQRCAKNCVAVLTIASRLPSSLIAFGQPWAEGRKPVRLGNLVSNYQRIPHAGLIHPKRHFRSLLGLPALNLMKSHDALSSMLRIGSHIY